MDGFLGRAWDVVCRYFILGTMTMECQLLFFCGRENFTASPPESPIAIELLHHRTRGACVRQSSV